MYIKREDHSTYSVLFYESIHVGFIIVVLFILFALNRGQTFLDNITIQWIYIYIYKKSTHICKKKKKRQVFEK